MVDVDEDPLELVPSQYDRWRERFGEERDRIERVLADSNLESAVERVEHVGSTAVPDLAAKDIVDVDVVVADDAVGAVSRAITDELGGTRIENSDAWHPIFREHGGQRFNDHVFAASSDRWRISVATREVLCERPDLRDAYERRKREAARAHDDLTSYSEAKTEIVQRILDVARDGDVSVAFALPDRSESSP